MRELRVKEVRRSCGVRGCPNTAKDGRVFSIMRTSEAGAGVVIMCEHCIKESYNIIFGNTVQTEPTAEPTAKKATAKKTTAKKTEPKTKE